MKRKVSTKIKIKAKRKIISKKKKRVLKVAKKTDNKKIIIPVVSIAPHDYIVSIKREASTLSKIVLIFYKVKNFAKLLITFIKINNPKILRKKIIKEKKKYIKKGFAFYRFYENLILKYFKKQRRKSIRKYHRIFPTESWRRVATAAFLIFLLFLGTFNNRMAIAATYSFSQTSWTGGITANTATHPSNQSGWNEYSAKTSDMAATSALSISPTSSSVTQTSNADFSAGTNSQTTVVGADAAASVKLSTTNFVAPMVANGAMSSYSSLLLKSDGTVWAWGYNGLYMIGDGTTFQRNTPVQVHSPDNNGFLTDVVSISSGTQNSYAIKSDGTVWAWGYNSTYQIGDNTFTNRLLPVQVHGPDNNGFLADIVAISGGDGYAIALKSDGTVWAWGKNSSNELGDNTITIRPTPIQVHGPGDVGFLTDIIAISSSERSSYALKSDGTVWAWGYNNTGQLGDNTTTQRATPVQVHGSDNNGFLTGVVSIKGGKDSVHAMKSDGTVWGWGYNQAGQLGDNSTTARYTPVQVHGLNNNGFLTDVVFIARSLRSSYAIKSDGTVWAWGYNNTGQLGDNTTTQRYTPVQVHGPENVGFLTGAVSISAADTSARIIKSDGTVWSWGYNNYGQLGDNTTIESHVPVQVKFLGFTTFNAGASGTRKVAAGGNSGYALKSDGTVWSWGANNYGQLGDNSTIAKYMPVQVSGLTGITAISAATASVYALKSDGTVWSWGANTNGQLGDNSITQRNVPVQVSGLTDVIAINGGADNAAHGFACALKSDNTVWCWGYNNYGQLGDNTTIESHVPVQVHGPLDSGFLTGISAIATGTNTGYALKSDGTMWSWGYSGAGQLGTGSNSWSYVPVQVKGIGGSGFLTGVSVIAGSTYDGYAIKAIDGSVYAWGGRSSGQLGNNTTGSNVTNPVQTHGPGDIGFLTDMIEIGGNNTFAYSIKSDGTMWSWGANANGQLGDNSTTQRNVPVQVSGLTNVIAVSKGTTMGALSNYAIKSDGTVWGWGDNASGQLGNYTTTQSLVPIQVKDYLPIENFNAGSNTYYSSGTFSSSSIDFGSKATFSNVTYSTTLNSQTITVDVHAGDVSVPDGTWTSWSTNIASGGSISGLGAHRYFQYRVNLSTSNTIYTPLFNDITINYSTYSTNQTLTSSAYDTGDASNVIGAINWNEDTTLPTGTGVTMSLRTAPSQGGLSSADWYNFTNATTHCTKVDTLVSCPTSALPVQFNGGGDDRWWQYKITLTSDGSATPTVSGVGVQYVVNAPPQLQNVTASQGLDGLVNISYDVKDPDTLTGSLTPGEITPSFEYWNGSAWVACTTLSSGATTNKDVNDTNFTTYTLTWNAKTDFNNQYTSSAKIKVIVNDNEAANNIVSLESATFTLDTKNPIVDSFVLDARSDSTNDIAIGITEDNVDGIKMKLSNNSNLSADGLNAISGEWVDYAITIDWIFTNDNPTVYYQIKDKYQNISNGGTSSVILPARPLNIVYQDVSNVETSEWREFIAWGEVANPSLGFKQYNIYRSTDGVNYSLLPPPQTDRTINFVIDTGLDTNTTYYYRVTSEDNAGNTSRYSDVISDRPDGQGGSDLTPPVISNINVSNITAQSALVTWDTDEPSNSTVSYITNDSGDFTNAPNVGISSMRDNSGRLGNHSVFLNNLSAGVTYYIQVSSADPNGNTASDNANTSFTVLSGPTISNVFSSGIFNTGATITWNTSEASDSHVFYSTDSSFASPTEVATSESVTSHSINITGLSTGVNYFYYVKSGIAEDKNIVEGIATYYSFTTTADIISPVINFDGNIDITDKTENSVRISWTTNELATSRIEYSTDDSYDQFEINSNLNINHTFELTGLTRGTLYNFRLKNTDANGNLGTLSDLNFSTLDLSDTTPPIISLVQASPVYDTTAIITWTTNEASNSAVNYGTTSATYDESSTNALYDFSHSVILTDLDVSTKYYFTVTSIDGNNNSTTSGEFDFTTSATLTTGGGGVVYYDNSDRILPVISEALASNITSNQAIITWKTSELANSIAEFGITAEYGLASVKLTTSLNHSQKLTTLLPETSYYYKITSIDVSGNLSIPYTGNFNTLSLSQIPNLDNNVITTPEDQTQKDASFSETLNNTFDFIKKASKTVSLSVLEASLMEQQENIKELASLTPNPVITSGPNIKTWEDMAVISWETDKKTNSITSYSQEGFSLTDENNSQVVGNPEIYSLKHQVILSGLKPETTYNYQLKGSTIIGSSLVFKPDTFTTLSKSAKVDNYVADRLSEDTASFKWSSSLETNTSVRITPYRNNTLSYDEARVINDPKFTSIHQMTVDNFEPGVFYKIDLFGNDQTGRTLSQTIEAFSTANKELPFLIEQVKTSSALAAGESLKVQSIISWNTTKLSTSKVYYRKGTSKDDDNWPMESSLDSGFSRRHLVVMIDFDPGEIYQFQVESIDSNGQKVRSKTYTILTPRQKESVFQVILKNVEQTFGWMGGSGN